MMKNERMNSQATNMNKPILTQFRDSHPLIRLTACVVLLCFTTVFYSPAVLAVVQGIEKSREAPVDPNFPLDMQAWLDDIQAITNSVRQPNQTKETHWQLTRKRLHEKLEALEPLEERFNTLQQQEREQTAKSVNLERTRQRLEAQRQQNQANLKLLEETLQQAAEQKETTSARKPLQALATTLAKLNPPKPYYAYDSFTPFGPLDANARLPVMTQAALCTQLRLVAPCNSTGGPATADQTDGPDVVITPAITAQAQMLNNDPIAIFNWVYNHIQFIPSYGSIQGADMTLQTQRGSAIDTASLLIALMRAAGIPARYQYGTVEMTKTAVKNWVGNVEQDTAATNLLAQGGIPTAEKVLDGRVLYYTLEHTWVQAWMNNQWVALDPSFKYHHAEPGLDLSKAVPFDANTFAENIQSTAVNNETEGWVQNVDQAYIQNQLTNYRTQLEQYLTTNLPDATLGDVIGMRRLIERTATTLPTQLPYQKVLTTASFSAVPEQLRHQFGFTLLDQYGSELFTQNWHTSEIAAKNVALSFTPATPEDEQALLDLLPDNPQTLEELPQSLPANAFDVKAQLTVNGQVVAESTAMPFGRELKTRKGFWNERQGWRQTENPIVTGSYQAIGVDLHGASSRQMTELKSRMEATKTQLEAQQLNGLSKHEVVGDLLQAGVWSYLALTNVQSQLMAKTSNMVYFREPSYGTFQTNAVLYSFFGTPQNVQFTGYLMDMDSMKSSTECKANCWNRWVDFNKANGHMESAYEHIVPEQLFSIPDQPAEAISAVKAIAIAAQQGQRIYTFNPDNINLVHGLTIDQGTKDEIVAAVQAGMEATVHEATLNYAGWTGAGYIITDPQSGAGAYKIAGGSDGGTLQLIVDSAMFTAAAALGISDGYAGCKVGSCSPVWFEENLKRIEKLGKASAVLGMFTFLYNIITTLGDDSLSSMSKLGRISMYMLCFGITTSVIAATVAASGGFVGIGIVVGFIVGFAFEIASTLINNLYFSNILRLQRNDYSDKSERQTV